MSIVWLPSGAWRTERPRESFRIGSSEEYPGVNVSARDSLEALEAAEGLRLLPGLLASEAACESARRARLKLRSRCHYRMKIISLRAREPRGGIQTIVIYISTNPPEG